MTFLKVLLVVLLAFWLISLIRIGGRVCYGQKGLSVAVLIGPMRVQVLPAKPKKKKKAKKKEDQPPPQAEKHEKSASKDRPGTLW